MRVFTLVSALTSAAALIVWSADAVSQSTVQTAIVLDFTNKAGPKFDYLSRIATDQVAAELYKSGKYEILSRSEVQRKIKELDLKPPFDREARSRLAADLRAELIVDGTIEFVRENRKKKPTTMEVGLKIWVEDAQAGDLMSGAAVIGVAHRSDSHDAMTRELSNSIQRAGGLAVTRSLSYRPFEAVVLSTMTGPRTFEILLNRGSRQGMKEGMLLTVWREGKKVGSVRVKSVLSDDCAVEVVENQLGIRPEDRAISPFKMPDYSTRVFMGTPLKTVVLDFKNKTNIPEIDRLTKDAADFVSGGLTLSRRYEIVDRYVMNRKAEDLDLAAFPKFDDQAKLARELGAAVFVSGAVELVSKSTKNRPGTVSVGLSLRINDASSGDLLFGAVAIGKARSDSASKLSTDDLSKAIQNACENAVFKATADLIEGEITTEADHGDLPINRGEQDGVRQGMSFVVMRIGKVVGKMRAEHVFPTDSFCSVLKNVNGIKPGDTIRECFEPLAIWPANAKTKARTAK